MPAVCLVYPGHDYNGMGVSSIGEERRFNPRLGGDVAEADFAGFMQHLGLPHPKKMDLAVPANLRCGRPEGDIEMPADPGWAQLNFSIAGLWEIAPHALADVAAKVQVLDVREPEEFAHGLGHIEGALLLPLGQLEARSGRTAARQADRHRLPLGRTLGARRGDARQGWLRRRGQPARRHAALACRGWGGVGGRRVAI